MAEDIALPKPVDVDLAPSKPMDVDPAPPKPVEKKLFTLPIASVEAAFALFKQRAARAVAKYASVRKK